jgi:hypothetical protein
MCWATACIAWPGSCSSPGLRVPILAVASAVARFWGRWGSAELHRFLGLLVVIRQHFSAELQAFQERFSEGHLWLGPDRQQLAIGKSTYTLFGKSTLPFLIHSLVLTERSTIASRLSDTLSGDVFPVIIGLSVAGAGRGGIDCTRRGGGRSLLAREG